MFRRGPQSAFVGPAAIEFGNFSSKLELLCGAIISYFGIALAQSIMGSIGVHGSVWSQIGGLIVILAILVPITNREVEFRRGHRE